MRAFAWVQHTQALEIAQWCQNNITSGWWIEGLVGPKATLLSDEEKLLIHFEDEEEMCLFKLRWGLGAIED